MKNSFLALALILSFISCKTDTKDPETPQLDATDYLATEQMTAEEEEAYKITTALGLENWDKVNELRFTFNTLRGDNKSSRSWIWNPKSQDVVMMTASDTVRYNRTSVDSISLNADKSFINDSYWLLAPFHLVWDEEARLTVQDTATAPISKNLMKKITLTYVGEGGYTPGDAYDFFYDDKNMVREWIFRRGNAPDPSMTTTWEDYEDYKGIKISKTHNVADGSFKLFFTDISVKTEE